MNALSSSTLHYKKLKYIKIFKRSAYGFIAFLLMASPVYSSCKSTVFVDYYSHKDTYDHYHSATLEKSDSGTSAIIFGNQLYSETYYFTANGTVHKVRTCGYKCNPSLSTVKELPAKGKCKVRKLNSGKFNLYCLAVDENGEKHEYGLYNTVREEKGYPCYNASWPNEMQQTVDSRMLTSISQLLF